jgi:hypothetical protein
VEKRDLPILGLVAQFEFQQLHPEKNQGKIQMKQTTSQRKKRRRTHLKNFGFFLDANTDRSSERLSEGLGLGHFQTVNFTTSDVGEGRVVAQRIGQTLKGEKRRAIQTSIEQKRQRKIEKETNKEKKKRERTHGDGGFACRRLAGKQNATT